MGDGERQLDPEMSERIRKGCSHKQAAVHTPDLPQETPEPALPQVPYSPDSQPEHTYLRKSLWCPRTREKIWRYKRS